MWADAFFIMYCVEMVLALIMIAGFTIWITESLNKVERSRRIRFQTIYLTVTAIVLILTLATAIICKIHNV